MSPIVSKPLHSPLADSIESRMRMHAHSSHFQFVDISSRPLKLQSSAFVRAASFLHANRLTFRQRATLHHVLAMQNLPLLRSGWQPFTEKRNTFLASASSVSYSDNVEEGLLTLGGFCMSRREMQIASGAASTIIFAVANKVLYKMALVPLKEYPFFLALINTFGYVLVYFSILYMRHQAGIVTVEMLELPKLPFALAGALEALGLAAGMAAAANLPGTSISILLQTFLVWQLGLSLVFLKKRFSFGQVAACGLVLLGVAIALFGSGNGSGLAGNRTDLFWPFVMIVSCAFQASSTIVKEFVFQNASKHLKGGSVDIFVVNSYGSAFQSIFVLLMLPFLSQLRGIPFSQLQSYMKNGAGCLFNVGSMSTECSGATLLTLSYVVVNLAFNISLLSLLKMSSAVVSSLCSTLAVPIAIYIFTLPLPFIGVTASVHPQFVIGVMVLLSGLALYNFCGCYQKNGKHV
ncbi:hypothetical protein GOP47_0025828 [Adiantum capillus-veneris]|uniref:Uncharacterized protein n=1 Tax=Adiantum capillus-veneris TaxID=13818 RepID=A0A9D4U104_ADICA|nr:hypothetical protein GOP47_0025828 [Adiantum capillus-veneris]